MKILCLLSLILLISATRVPAPAPTDAPITGDYVEARTASVFAGACHYNGELVTSGQEAVMAWNVTAGTWNGTDLAGVRAVAAVSCDANLADAHAVRQSELVIDTAATEAQAAAFTAAMETRFAASLGKVISVKRGPVTFRHDDVGYEVAAAKFAACSVQPMPDAGCCKQPNLVWYTPLVPLQNRRVGFTSNAAYTAATLGDAWQRAGENSAFYGRFSF